MNRERLQQGCEWGIGALLMVALFFAPLAMGGDRPQDFCVVRWLVFGMAFLWALRVWAMPSSMLVWPAEAWVILGFLVYATLRTWFADLTYVAHQEWTRVLTYSILFWVVVQNVSHPKRAQWIGLAMVGLAMMISWYALYQFFTGSDRVWGFERPPQYAGRGSGTYICPNHLAGFLELIQSVALAFTVMGRFGPIAKVFLGYSFLVITAGLLVTVSRGGYIASLVSNGLLLTWLLRAHFRRLWPALAVGLTLILGSFLFLRPEFSLGRPVLDRLIRNSEDVRTLVWKPAWRMWQDHFWFGVGPDHFDYRFRQYRPADWDIQSRPDRVHNDYLNVLVDWGLVGSLFPLAFGILFIRKLSGAWNRMEQLHNEPSHWDHNLMGVVSGTVAGLVAILVHSFFDYNLHVAANAMVVTVWVALLVGMVRRTHLATEGDWGIPRTWIWRLVPAGAALLLGCQNGIRTWELHLKHQADRQADFSDERIKAMERVVAWVPSDFETPYQIGEAYRLRSWQGFDGFEALAHRAMEWYERAWRINPFDPYNFVKYGMCLDWINEKAKAEPYFRKAHELDPNGYFITALVGWHYLNVTNYTEAKRWFERSIRLYGAHNVIAAFYLNHVNQKLAEQASGQGLP